MSTAVTQQSHPESLTAPSAAPKEIVVYSHSPIYYWWPVWAIGFVFALLTWIQGKPTQFVGDTTDFTVLIHPNPSLGVLFTLTFFLVIVITHFSVRGTASLTVIVAGIALALFLAYMRWWEPLIRAFSHLAIFMNLGFYVFFSTAVFGVWASAVLFFDRFTYWKFKPGQMVYHSVLGDGEQTYDTGGMSVDKKQYDLFRHWVLGLGSGDIHVMTAGAKHAEFTIPNVLFVGSKLNKIQELVAMKPDQLTETVLTAGNPV